MIFTDPRGRQKVGLLFSHQPHANKTISRQFTQSRPSTAANRVFRRAERVGRPGLTPVLTASLPRSRAGTHTGGPGRRPRWARLCDQRKTTLPDFTGICIGAEDGGTDGNLRRGSGGQPGSWPRTAIEKEAATEAGKGEARASDQGRACGLRRRLPRRGAADDHSHDCKRWTVKSVPAAPSHTAWPALARSQPLINGLLQAQSHPVRNDGVRQVHRLPQV